jgi:hypothetical protein
MANFREGPACREGSPKSMVTSMVSGWIGLGDVEKVVFYPQTPQEIQINKYSSLNWTSCSTPDVTGDI